jgi:hypothetical protein
VGALQQGMPSSGVHLPDVDRTAVASVGKNSVGIDMSIEKAKAGAEAAISTSASAKRFISFSYFRTVWFMWKYMNRFVQFRKRKIN